MTPEMSAKLKRSLILHEGYRKFPYTDETNHITIGIGFNISDRGMTDLWINQQFADDIQYFYTQLDSYFPWFKDLNSDRQVVLIDMCFNLGFQHFREFQHMILALSIHDYAKAAIEMLDSPWADQVKSRAIQLSHGMATGQYDV